MSFTQHLRNLRPGLVAGAASLLIALPAAAQYGAPAQPQLSAPGAAVGSEVTVSMTQGLPPGSRMSMGFGGLSGSYELVGRAETDSLGAFSIRVAIPAWAERNRIYYFFLNTGGATRLFSDPFIVTGADGALTVTGFVTEMAGGCVVIAGFDETKYALLGVTTRHAVGDRVTVDGNLGTAQGVVPDGSPCARRPSIPIRVREVRAG
jgi:hypothetical protein